MQAMVEGYFLANRIGDGGCLLVIFFLSFDYFPFIYFSISFGLKLSCTCTSKKNLKK